jgi:DNA invertase Pin-like site-specific DNA recombinase
VGPKTYLNLAIHGANLKVLEQNVNTSTAAGRAFFGMLAVFAAFETEVRRERQMEGIAMAKRKGIYEGGKPRLDRARQAAGR